MPKTAQDSLPTECDIAEIALGSNVREVDLKSEGFKELAASVKTHGILEPLVVRPLADAQNGHKWDLVAGYQRYAAAKVAGLTQVPVVVRYLNDSERAEVQLLENILRKDLTPMEEARGIKAYADAFAASPKEISARVHKSGAWVKSRLALNSLSAKLIPFLEDGSISVTQATAIAAFPTDVQELLLEDEAEELRYGGIRDSDADEITRMLENLGKQLEDVRAFEKKVEASEHKVCPKCGGAATGKTYDGLATCDNGHEWSLATGKGRSVKENVTSYAKAPAPKKIDRSETCVVRAVRSPQEIMGEYLGGVKVDYIRVVPSYSGVDVTFALSGKNLPDSLQAIAKLKEGARGFALMPVEYSSGEMSQVVVDGYDGPARKKMKALVRNFLADFDSGKAKGTASDLTEAIATLLKGEREDVMKRLGKLKLGDAAQRELLERAREFEAENEARVSLMVEMDKLLGHEMLR